MKIPIFSIIIITSAAIRPSSQDASTPEFSSSSDKWFTFTKILAKKGVNLSDHADKSIQIASPADGDFLTFIRDSSYWVDKSLLIRRLFEELWNYNSISTAPPKWGKTINLSMLKFYCQLPLDSEGFEIPKNQSASYLYFNEGKVVSRNGTIEELDGAPLIKGFKHRFYSGYKEHLANYPVIHVTGANVTGKGIESLRTLLHETYKRHPSVLTQLMLKSGKTKGDKIVNVTQDLCDFLSFYDPKQISKVDGIQLRYGIQILTRILYNIYNRKVVLLVDDFDYFAQKAFVDIEPSNLEEFRTTWNRFIRFTFKSNDHLERALITGVLNIRDPASFQQFQTNYNKYVFDDQDLFPYYGIFENEFSEMASRRGIDQSSRDKATKWYGGYRTLSHLDVEMYSPYSVTRFFNTLQFQSYSQISWLSDFVLGLIRKKEVEQRIRSLIESFDNNTISTSFKYRRNIEFIDWKEYVEMTRTERDGGEYDASKEILIFSLLVSTGCVAMHEDLLDFRAFRIKIPNVEIRDQICKVIGGKAK